MFARSIITLGIGVALCVSGSTLAAPPPPDTASVELVEFASFQCPFSAREVAVVDGLRKQYGAKLTFSYRHLPLAFHEHSRGAAIAYEAARRQGKAEAMYDKLFANQRALLAKDLRGYAEAIGLDLKRYDQDIADPAVAAMVDNDAKIAGAVGAIGTPTFFINGKKVAGAQPADAFTTVIDEELAAAGAHGGATWRVARIAANNADFHRYVVLGEAAPDKPVAPEPAPPVSNDATLEGEALKLDVKGAPTTGKGKTQVVIFGDLQCPFTQRAFPKYTTLSDANPGKLTVVFKHLPLPFHAMARPAAEAVACAEEQKKGWLLASSIFAHGGGELSAETLAAWASDAGLDNKKQQACLAAGRGAKVVDRDMKDAEAAGARGTPTVFVNGKRLSNWAAPNAEALVLQQ